MKDAFPSLRSFLPRRSQALARQARGEGEKQGWLVTQDGAHSSLALGLLSSHLYGIEFGLLQK